MPKDEGTDWKLYTAQAQPSDPTDETDTEYNLVGHATEVELNPSRDMIESVDKDSGKDMEVIPGRRDTEVSGSFHALEDYQPTDEGQEDLHVSMNNEQSIYWLITDGVGGNQVWHGQGFVTELTVTAPDNDMLTMDVTIRADGGYTRAEAAT